MDSVYFKIRVFDLTQEMIDRAQEDSIYDALVRQDGVEVILGYTPANIPVEVFRQQLTPMSPAELETEVATGNWVDSPPLPGTPGGAGGGPE